MKRLRYFIQSISTFILNVKYIHLICLGLLGLLPLLWFRDNYIIRPEELSYINYSFLFDKYFYAWSSHTSNGLPSTFFNQLTIYPIGILYKIFEFFNFPEQTSQKLILILFFELTLFSIYRATLSFSQNSKLISIYAAVFYTFNFYMLSTPFYTAKMLQAVMLPVLFTMTLGYLKTGKFFYLILNFAVLFLCQGLFSNIANAITTLFIYLIAIAYYIYTYNRSLRETLKSLVLFFLSLLPILINIASVFYFSVLVNNLYIKLRDTNAFANTFLATRNIRLFEMFRGAWWEDSRVYNQWADYYNNPLINVLLIVLFSIIFVGLITIKNIKNRRQYIFWLLMFCIIFFFTKGTNQPLGVLYKLIFQYFPGFFVFREPWAKFSPLLIFSCTVLFSIVLSSLSKHPKILRIIPFLLVINGFPFITPNVFNHINTGYSSINILIPDYWRDIHEWSKENKDLNIFTLPVIYGTEEYYNWQGYNTGNLSGSFAYTYLLSNSINKLDDPSGVHFEFLKTYSPKLISIFNVDYVLDQSDVVKVGKNINYSVNDLIRDRVIESTPSRRFGKLNLYKVTPEYYLPRVYIPDKVLYYDRDDTDTIPSIFNIDLFTKETAFITSPQIKSDNIEDILKISAPNIIKSNLPHIQDWDDGWAWPASANINPASWKYRIVRLSEHYSLFKTQDALQQVDLHIWFAAKRVSEMEKYHISSNTANSLVNNYFDHIEKAVKLLENYPVDKRNDSYWGAVRKTVMYMDKFSQADALSRREFYSKNKKIHEGFRSWVINNTNPYCRGYCYESKGNKHEKYNLYLSNAEVEEVTRNNKSISSNNLLGYIYISDQDTYNLIKRIDIRLSEIKNTNGFINIGEINIPDGKTYIIDLNLPEGINLVSSGEWYTPDIKDSKDYEVNFTPQSHIKGYDFDLDYGMNLWNNSIRFKPINDWEPNNKYKISFQYRTNKGQLGVAIAENSIDISSLVKGDIEPDFENIDNLPMSKATILNTMLKQQCVKQNGPSECWNDYEKTISSGTLSTSAFLYVYAISDTGSFSDISIRDIKVELITEPNPILIPAGFNSINNGNKPKIELTQVNPTKYYVNVSNATEAYYLVFSQTFHSKWNLYLPSNDSSYFSSFLYELVKKPVISEDKHYIANGFANVWKINPSDVGNNENYTLVLEYSPQRLFYIVLLLNVLGFIICFIYILYFLIFRKEISTTRITPYRNLYNILLPEKIEQSGFYKFYTKYLNKIEKYKNILLFGFIALLSWDIFISEYSSDLINFPLILFGLLIIKIHNIRTKALISTLFSFLAFSTVLIIIGTNTQAEKLITWTYTLVCIITLREIIKLGVKNSDV